MNRGKYLAGVDGLRAIAVLFVVLFHAGFSAFSGGFVGVDVFFVISGFLITRLIRDEVTATGRLDFSGFYVRRARRLFPALFVTFVACFAAAFLLFTPQHFQRFGGELQYAAVSLSNIFFWSENGYFDTSADFKPLLHTWSLSVEEQFYLIWPMLLFLVLRKTGKRGVWCLLALVGAASLYANIRFQNGYTSPWVSSHGWLATRLKDGATTIFFLTPFRFFEFAIGAALVWIEPKFRERRAFLEAGMAAGLGLIGFAIFRFDQTTTFPSYNALVPCLGAAFVIVSTQAPVMGLAVRNRVSVFIGLISYSLYLVHWPLLVFYKYWRLVPISMYERVSLVIASIALGYVLFRFVETPFRGRGQRQPRLSRAGVGFACSSLLLGVSLIASTVWANDGFPWRVAPPPPDIAAQIANSKQFHVDQYGGNGFPEPTGWINPNGDGRADIVLIGDSHAGQLKTGLQNITHETNQSVYFSTSSCLILPGMTRFTPGTDWDQYCPAALDNALKVLKSSPSAVVILAEDWGFQVERASYLKDGKKLLRAESLTEAIRELAPKIAELKKDIGDRRLIIVGQVPGAGAPDAIGCFLRPKYLKFNCNEILTTSELDNKGVLINAALKDDVKNVPRVTFINPFDVFCDGRRCRTLDRGRVLYSDGDHLSKVGSQLMQKIIKPALTIDTPLDIQQARVF